MSPIQIEPIVEPVAHDDPVQSLLRAYQASGRPEDFHEIVTRFAPLVFAECRRVTRDAHDAEDAAQLAFLALAIEIRAGTAVRSPGAWLQRVAKRQALKIVRSRGRRKRREDAARRPETAPPQPVEPDPLPAIVRAAIDELPERYRLPLVLHYFGGMKLESIARELRLTRQAVGTRLHRGRKMLGEKLAAHDVVIDHASLATIVAMVVPAAVVASLVRSSTAAVASSAAPTTSLAGGVSAMLNAAIGAGVQPAAVFCATRPIAAMIVVAGLAATSLAIGPATPWLQNAPLPSFDLKGWIKKVFAAPLPMPTPTTPPMPLTLVETRRVEIELPEPLPARWPDFGGLMLAAQAPMLYDPPPPAVEPALPTFASLPALRPLGLTLNDTTPLARIGPLSPPPMPAAQELRYKIRFQTDTSPADFLRDTPPPPTPRTPFHLPTLKVGTRGNALESYLQSGGEVKATSLEVGTSGRGRYEIRGGRLDVGRLTLGEHRDGHGELLVRGNATVHVRDPDAPIRIGVRGAGRLVLGDADGPGRLTTPAGSRAPIVVGEQAGSRGVIQGWGIVESRGPLVNNGKVIADGFGRNRTLDLTCVEAIENTTDNPRDGDAGWYAQRGGALALPPVVIPAGDGVYNWGESKNDESIDLVNSARIGVHGQPEPTSIRITLRASDGIDISLPGGVNVLSFYQIDTLAGEAAFRPSLVDLAVRYDHNAASLTALGESAVALYAFDGSHWTPAADQRVSLAYRQLSGSVEGSLVYFMVGVPDQGETGLTSDLPPHAAPATTVPEPAGLAALAGALLLTRQRRTV